MANRPPGELVNGDERASSSSSSSSSLHGRASAHDVDPRQYATVIREMIRHENEVTNHRIMWLLVVQGLLANAYVGAAARAREKLPALPGLGIVVTLSAFVLLYKSYHARGYLTYLGGLAKRGMLTEQQLPLMGWPDERIKGWRNEQWICRWLGRSSDLLEPYFLLPALLILLWTFELLRLEVTIGPVPAVLLAAGVAVLILACFCVAWIWKQGRDEKTIAATVTSLGTWLAIGSLIAGLPASSRCGPATEQAFVRVSATTPAAPAAGAGDRRGPPPTGASNRLRRPSGETGRSATA